MNKVGMSSLAAAVLVVGLASCSGSVSPTKGDERDGSVTGAGGVVGGSAGMGATGTGGHGGAGGVTTGAGGARGGGGAMATGGGPGSGGMVGSGTGGRPAGSGGQPGGAGGQPAGTGGQTAGMGGRPAGMGGQPAGVGGRTGTGGTIGTGGTMGTPDGGAPNGVAKGPLRIDSVNPRYFNDGAGHVIYLTGSHTWQTLKDRALTDPPPPFDYDGYLNFMVAHNHNFFRLWTWEQTHSWNNNTDHLNRWFLQFPWQRTGPGTANDGKPAFDLTKFDQSYFDRIRARVIAAGNRGIYVAITLFNGWDVFNAFNAVDGGFPYGAGNNVNGVASGGAESQMLTNAAVTTVQEAYVRKVIDTVNDLDNVLYEIANETTQAGVTWQNHMITVVKQYQAGKPRQHPVGMTATSPGSDADLYASAADWIAPIAMLATADGRKVVINDTDHSYYWTVLKGSGTAAQQAWAWKTFTLGGGSLFMDPYLEPWTGRNNPSGTTPDPSWEQLRFSMGYTRTYANKLDLQHAVPSGNLSSTGSCLANPGVQYLVYQPSSGAFTLMVLAGTYNFEWFDPTRGVVSTTGTVTLGAGSASFTPPFTGDAVLLLSR